MSLTKLANEADGLVRLQAWGVPAGATMLISDQEFADKDVVLDGVEFERCRFTRCKLIRKRFEKATKTGELSMSARSAPETKARLHEPAVIISALAQASSHSL